MSCRDTGHTKGASNSQSHLAVILTMLGNVSCWDACVQSAALIGDRVCCSPKLFLQTSASVRDGRAHNATQRNAMGSMRADSVVRSASHACSMHGGPRTVILV
jgi:hypothetical protein